MTDTGGFGHTAVILKDSQNDWYLFRWGNYAALSEVDSNNLNTMEGINIEAQKTGILILITALPIYNVISMRHLIK